MLTGLRVLDLSRVLAGPLCSMMLGDMGADVIKVERPQVGDDTRSWGPPFDEEGRSAYYLSVNRNKLGMVADLGLQGDRDLLIRLMSSADVVLENFRAGSLSATGLDPDELCSRFPRLVWCTITGFDDGSGRPGYDVVVQAECGWMSITGDPAGDPMKVGVALADVVAGKDSAIAILGALIERSRTGRGRRIITSLSASARAALVNVAQNSLVTGREAERWGNAHPNLVPYQLFMAADRAIIVAVGNDAQWQACARALGLEDLGRDESLSTNSGRVAHRERVVGAMAERVAAGAAADWCARLTNAGVPAGLVRGVLEALEEAGDCSPLTGVAPSIPGRVRFPPPGLDEHGEIVRRLGWEAFVP